MSKETLDFVTHIPAEKLQNFFGVFLQFHIGVDSEYVKKAAKKYQNREDFAKQLRSEVMYYFWSKCEWEVLVTPWISPRESEKKKIDVCWQIMNNWDVFVDYTWANRKKL